MWTEFWRQHGSEHWGTKRLTGNGRLCPGLLWSCIVDKNQKSSVKVLFPFSYSK